LQYGGDKRAEETNNENTTQVVPTVIPIKSYDKMFFGRRVLKYSLDKKDLTAEKIMQILPEVLREHEKNAKEINYLYRYYKGFQPILKKEKNVRPEINNKVLENHAFEIVEFKKAYVYGEPVQYVQKGEKNSEYVNPEISIINKYMESEDKSSKDKDLAEWQYICGTAYRWADIDNKEDEDEAPFEISTPDPRRTFVVYSSGIKEEQLFSGHYSWFSENLISEDGQSYTNKYRIITIYTEDKMYKFKESFGVCELMQQNLPQIGIDDEKEKQVEAYPLLIKGHRIVEYPLNTARLGLIELVMSGLNALNRIKSDDLDGIDQFIQSLLVFVNQQIDVEDFKRLVEAGAIEVSTTDPGKPADVKLLTSQLLHSETKIVTDDIYNNVLTICGIPRLNDKPSGGDTGQARLLGEGWTMADERAKQDELSFKKSERQFLKLILNICKHENQIKNLKISDIDIKFTRNKSDNLLVKTQGLMNMKQAQVTPEVAFTICGLFSDPNDVYAKSKKFFGEDFWKSENPIQNTNTNINEEDNKNSKKENQSIKDNQVSGGKTNHTNNENDSGKTEV
jgi:SPP1 family phage portal protein